MSEILYVDPQDQAIITVEWDDLLEVGITFQGEVTHIVPAPLEKVSEATDAANKRSFVTVRGQKHGGLYSLEAQAVLSNGETVNKNFPVRCSNDG